MRVSMCLCARTCAQEQVPAPAHGYTGLPSHLLSVVLGWPWATLLALPAVLLGSASRRH